MSTPIQAPQVALQSVNSTFDAAGFETVKSDLQHLALSTPSSLVRLSGADRFDCPVSGNARVYCVSDTSTVGDGAGANHVVSVLKSGGSPGTPISTAGGTQIKQYTELFLGQFPVTVGNLLKLNVAVTGGPTPTLSTANFSLRCDIAPSATTAS
jgi:hypothetical protein